MAVSSVQDEGDTPLFQTHARRTGVIVSETEVDDRGRETIVPGEGNRIGQSSGRQDDGTRLLERCDKVERNDRLILDDEDRATGKVRALHNTFAALPSASARDAAGLRVAACPEPSINPQGTTNAMIDRVRSSAHSEDALDVATTG